MCFLSRSIRTSAAQSRGKGSCLIWRRCLSRGIITKLQTDERKAGKYGKIKILIALWVAKLSIVALKITGHNGTNFPGVVAIRICPQFLKYIGKPERIIAVTGTNGKTTVANMIIDALALDGKDVINNRAGSNINTGIATSLIQNCGISGKCSGKLGVLK